MALLLLFLRHSEIFLSAYPRTIIFGKSYDKCPDETNAFIFDLTLLTNLYKAIVHILSALRSSEVDKSETICESDLNVCYWKVCGEDSVSFFKKLKTNDKIVLNLRMNYVQLNEFIFALSKITIPTLCLKDDECDFFDFLLDSKVENLVDLTRKSKFEVLLKTTKFEPQVSRLFLLFLFYLDIVFIVSKFNLFSNDRLLPSNLENLLNII